MNVGYIATKAAALKRYFSPPAPAIATEEPANPINKPIILKEIIFVVNSLSPNVKS